MASNNSDWFVISVEDSKTGANNVCSGFRHGRKGVAKVVKVKGGYAAMGKKSAQSRGRWG